MSSRATAWAWTIKLKPGSAHHLFLAMCENANFKSDLSYPAVETLCDMTGQDRKTVLAGLQRLVAAGLMIDTGKKTGRTQQITVYRMLVPEEGKNGTVKEARKRTGKSPVSPSKESRFRDTEPIKEPSKGEDSNHYDAAAADRDLLGDPIIPPEAQLSIRKADTIRFIEAGWNDLSAEVPKVAGLRSGKLDEARAETAIQRAEKFAAEGESAIDIWTALFRQVRSSRWLCGETQPRDERPPFTLQLTWLLENRNFTKVLEGKFADGRDPDLRGGGNARSSPAGAAMSIVLDRRRSRRDRGNGRGSGSGASPG